MESEPKTYEYAIRFRLPMTVQDTVARTGPRKLLALDGGGIRGLISIEVLAEIERTLQGRLGRDDTFVLSDYFDYVSGTSTGVVVATCIAVGMRVDEIRAFYVDHGEQMFDEASLLRRWRSHYEDEQFAGLLKTVLGKETTLGSEKLRILLMIVMRNASTDSPWPLSNNPAALYNQRDREASNLDLPLWQLIRASTAAPTFFPPEVIDVGDTGPAVFVDGGVTVYNNPAFQLFLMAEAPHLHALQRRAVG